MPRAGQDIEDFCRACKTDRMHTIVATDGQCVPLRVRCGYCDSEHNFRGGPRVDADTGAMASRAPSHSGAPRTATAAAAAAPFPIVSERERTLPMTPVDHPEDLELLLRRVIREENGATTVTPAAKWRGGTMVLRPADASLQEKTWPIETFFHKVVMLRNRLRTLEQHINASDLPDDGKVKLQAYITGCYGSLTSFNLLFADERDQFKGQGE
ncbi:MAG TPA: hypothetical protein PKW63_16080 [Vicinamibacterales bacterium]|nr:hypothetical protein [Acidobacteriota bacterium]HQX83284.1 hypothetical protein [Vicinamibacterales bacterium]